LATPQYSLIFSVLILSPHQDYSVPPCTSPYGPAYGRSNLVPDKFVKPGNAGIKTQCLNRLATPQYCCATHTSNGQQ